MNIFASPRNIGSRRKRRATDDIDTTRRSTDDSDGSCLFTGYETDIDEYVVGSPSSSVKKARYTDTCDSSTDSSDDYDKRWYYKGLKRKYDDTDDDTDSDSDTDVQDEEIGMSTDHKKRRFQ